jgi:hypothetical protein
MKRMLETPEDAESGKGLKKYQVAVCRLPMGMILSVLRVMLLAVLEEPERSFHSMRTTREGFSGTSHSYSTTDVD